MARTPKPVALAVRSFFESLENRRYLSTVTLTASGYGNSLYAQLNTATNNIDFYKNVTPGNGTPVTSIPASQLTVLQIQDTAGPTDSLTINTPGISFQLDVSGAAGIPLYVSKGGVTLGNTQSFSTINVGTGAIVTISDSSASIHVVNSVLISGTFQHLAGALVTPFLETGAGGTFVDAGGTFGDGGANVTIYNSGTFDAKTPGSLNNTPGTFYQRGLFIEDIGTGNTNTVTMAFIADQVSSFDLVSGTVDITTAISATTNLEIDGTAGTLEVPSYYDPAATVTQTGGTFKVDGLLTLGEQETRTAAYDLLGGTLTAGSLLVAESSAATWTQSGGTIQVSGEADMGEYGSGLQWTMTGGSDTFGTFVLGDWNSDASTLNFSGGSITAGTTYSAFGDQVTINLSGTATWSTTSTTLGSWQGTCTVNQSSGTFSGGDLHMGAAIYGTCVYNLSGGELDAGNEYLTKNADFSSDIEYATIHQTGGTNRTDFLIVGDGPGGKALYEMDGGTLIATWLVQGGAGVESDFVQTAGETKASVYISGNVGPSSSKFTLSGGSVDFLSDAYVGYAAAAEFDQSGGTLSVTDNLYISGDGFDGDYPDGHGTYVLSGNGQLSSANTFVGYGEDGAFTQSGGTHTTGYFVLNGPSGTTGTFTHTGGTLMAAQTVNVLKPSAGGASVVDEGSPYALNLSATSNVGNNAISSWAVDWGDQSNNAYNGNPSVVQHTYGTGGHSVTINATATGGGRNYPSAPLSVLVNDVPASVTPISDLTVNAGTPVNFSTTFTDPGTGETHTATINWGDIAGSNTSAGTVTESGGSGTISSSHTYLTHGTYTASLMVTDSGGAVAIVPFTVNVAYVAPTFSVSAEPASSTVGDTTTVSLNASGPEAPGVTAWKVDWGDGTVQTYTDGGIDVTPGHSTWTESHVYNTQGSYTISASATDSQPDPHSAGTTHVSVAAAPQQTLGAPSALSGDAISSTEAALSWHDNANDEDGFHVYASENGGPFALSQSLPNPHTGILPVQTVITGLTPGATYVFNVTAYAGTQESSASQATLVQMPTTDNPALSISGPASVASNETVRYSVDGSATETGDPTYVWSAMLNGTSVASGQGASFSFLPAISGAYQVSLTRIQNGAAPATVSEQLIVNAPTIASCTVLGPPISEIDHLSVFYVGTSGLNLGNIDEDHQPTCTWTVRNPVGDIIATRTDPTFTFAFEMPTTGVFTISATVNPAPGGTVYQGSVITTSTVGAPDDYKKAFIDFGTTDETPDQVIQDLDGNFLLVGTQIIIPAYRAGRSIILPGGGPSLELAKFKSDLTMDTSWGDDGLMTINLQPLEPNQESPKLIGRQIVRELDNGGFLIAAQTEDTSGSALIFFKLLPNGQPDDSFGDNGMVLWTKPSDSLLPADFGRLEDMQVAPDGSIVISGNVLSGQPGGIAAVMRFNADGSLDDGSSTDSDPSTSFGQHGMAIVSLTALLGPEDPRAAGDNAGDYHVDWAMSLLIGADGSIYVGGDHIATDLRDDTPTAAVGLEQEVFKLTSAGVLDPTFGPMGNGIVAIDFGPTPFGAADFGNTLLQDSQGRLLLVGSSEQNEGYTEFGDQFTPGQVQHIIISRLTPNGQLDPTFGQDPTLPGRVISNLYGSEEGWDAALTPDDKIVVAGPVSYENPDKTITTAGFVARFNVDGSPDTTFGGQGQSKIILDQDFLGVWQSVIVASNGNVVVAGRATKTNADGTAVDGFGIAEYQPHDVSAADLIATAASDGTIALNWVDTGTDEDGFVILRSTSPSGPAYSDVVGTVGKGVTSWTDLEAEAGTRYYYKVVAFDTSSDGTEALHGETNIATAQAAPKNTTYVYQETIEVPVTGATVQSQLSLLAGDNYRITASGYFDIDQNPNLTQRKRADAQWGLYNPTPSEYGVIGKKVEYGIGINDEELGLNRFPFWGAPSTDAAHTYTIDYSPQTTGPIKLDFHDNYYPDNQPGYYLTVEIYRALPGAPETVNATTNRPLRRIDLTWVNTATDATSILLQRSAAGGAFTTIATLKPDADSFSDSDITFNTDYAYRLIARNAFGDSGYSNEAVAVMVNAPPQIDFVDPITIRVGSPVVIQLQATDPDGPSSGLSYSLTGAPAGVTVDSDGEISGFTVNPDEIQTGPEDGGKPYYLGETLVWRAVVTDQDGGTADRFIALTIAPALNTIPSITTQPYIVSQTDTTATVSTLASDDGPESALTYTWVLDHRPYGVPLPTYSDNGTNSAKNTTISFSAPGTYQFEVRADDGTGYYGSAPLTITVAPVFSGVQVINPVVSLNAGDNHSFTATALDQFGRAWDSTYAVQPTFTWSVSGTAHGQIDPTTGVYQAPATVSGDAYDDVVVTATSDNVTKTADGDVNFTAGNQAPVIDTGADGEPEIDAEPLNFTQVRLTVVAHDPDGPASDLTYRWTADPVGSPAVTFSENSDNAASTTIATCPDNAALNYTFTVTVSDKQGGTTSTFITLTDSRTFSTIDLTPKTSTIGVGKTTTFHATAEDQYNRQLFVQPSFVWSVDGVVAADQTGQDFVYTAPDTAGVHAITVTAVSDDPDETASANVTVAAVGPATRQIVSPGGSADGTPPKITAATPIQIISDNPDGDAAPWQIWLTPPSESGEKVSPVLLASGSSSIGQVGGDAGTAATIDPASYPDGIYTLTLTDGNGVAADTKQIQIQSQFKLGNLTLPFTDLTANLPNGQSLSMGRTYDSSQASVAGQLGYGWTLNLNDAQLHTTAVGVMGDTDPIPALRQNDLVYITLPNGEQHVFAFVPMPESNHTSDPEFGAIAGIVLYTPRFVAVDGSGATLDVSSSFTANGSLGDAPIELTPNDGRYLDASNRNYNPAEPTDGEQYTVKTSDGTSYTLDAKTGQFQTVTDPNGNAVTYAQALTVQKDPQGRVISVTAPSGQKVQYHYDTDGDLDTETSPTGAVTQYFYVNHLLTQIVDPRGITVLTASYVPGTSQLMALTNNTGKSAPVQTGDFDGTQDDQTVTDTAGNTTEDVYDDHGDVIRKIETLTDANHKITGYRVTVSDYSYFDSDVVDPVARGYSLLNMLVSQRQYASFEIDGADPTGLRYSQQPTTVQQQIDYDWNNGDSDADDPNLRQPTQELTLLGPTDTAGQNRYRVTTFGDYKLGKPQDVAESIQIFESGMHAVGDPTSLSSTTSVYDTHGNLTSSTDNLTGVVTSYAYTDGTGAYAGIAKGLLLDTYRGTAATPQAMISSNDYYTATSAAAGALIGKLKSTTTYTTDTESQTTYYAYDSAGDVVLTWTPKTWKTSAGTSVGGWTTSATAYDLGGRVTDTYTGTYLGTGAPVFTVSVATATSSGNVTITSPLYDDVTQSQAAANAVPLHTSHTDYTADGQVADSYDQYQQETINTYDAGGHLIRVQYPDGTETRSVYDSLGRVIWQTDRFKPVNADLDSTANVSGVTHTLYDSAGNAYRTERYAGVAITLTPDTNAGVGGVLMAVAPSPATAALSFTQTWYDDQDRPIETEDAGGLRTGTIYDGSGNVAYTGPLTAAAPDGGRVTIVNGVTTIAFTTSDLASSTGNLYSQPNTSSGQPWSGASYPFYDRTTDANLRHTDTYTSTDGLTTFTVYDDGSFTESIRSAGDQPITGFDLTPTIPTGGSETITIAQRKNIASDPIEATIKVYDRSGNLTDVWLPQPDTSTARPHWQYAYDASGNEISQTDPKLHTTLFAYDENGNRVSRTLPPDSDGNTANDTERWTYDQNGRMLTHTDFKGQTTVEHYDDTATGDGRLSEEDRYAGAVTMTPDEKTVYGYNDLGQQTSVDEYAGATLTRPTTTTYDPVTGGVTEVDSPEGVIHHAYDQATGQLIHTWTTNNDTTYDYDAQGRLSHVRVNKLNGVSFTTPQVTTYTYDAVGNLLTTTEDEGTSATSDDLVTTDTYDDLNRLQTLTETHGGVDVFAQTFSYTDDSQKHDVLEKRYSTDGTTFTSTRITWGYDYDDRLTSEQRDEGDDDVQNGGDYTDTFTYDLNGNRITKTHDAVGTTADTSTTSAYNDRDELTSDTTNGTATNYTYDPNGSTLTNGSTAYTWDLRNRMLTATVADATTTYAYDADGVRVSKMTGTQKTTFLNDDENPTGYAKPIEEAVNGTLNRSYVTGLDVEAQADSTGETTILRDGRGYARTLIGGTGLVSQTVDVDAFGNVLDGVTSATPFESPDGYYDIETGSEYQQARYRSDNRFLSQDSITQSPGDLSDADLYSFVASDPLNGIDPSGHFLLSEALFTIGFAVILGSLTSIKYITSIAGSYRVSPLPAQPDVSGQLIGIRKDLAHQYQNLSSNERRTITDDIFNYSDSAANWDIKMLAALGATHQTVTVGQKAYVADEVNYWLYGCWLSIAGVPRIFGETATYLHRKFQTVGDAAGSGIDGRLAWFNAGYDNNISEAASSYVSTPASTAVWGTTLQYHVGTYPQWIKHDEGTPYQ